MRRKEDAIREGRRAFELEPESQDAFHGAIGAANLALVSALVGEPDQAITLIERLLSTPGAASYPVGRIASRSLSFVCGGNGIRSEAIRVSRRFLQGWNRRRSINTHCEFGEFVRRASGRSRSCLRRSSPPSRQRGIKVKGRSHNKWQLP